MKLGAFSLSLAVKDLEASLQFYVKLGFEKIGGEGKYAMLRNDTTLIGLFEGMFEENLLTFNPGWDHLQGEVTDFTDARELRSELQSRGVEVPDPDEDEAESGPTSFFIQDPDGNVILVDQHL